MIALIAAVAKNRVIGNSGKIPWHLPADFLYFKQTTLGHPVIMGKTTYVSIGKPLPGRSNIVLSLDDEYFEGVEVEHSLPAAISRARESDDEVFIIGGAQIYAQSIDIADRLYVTEVDCTPEGDTYFPEVEENKWKEISREHRAGDENNSHNMDFVVYERKK